MTTSTRWALRVVTLCGLAMLAACNGDHVNPTLSAPPPAAANPTASFAAPATAVALQPVALDASASTSTDGSQLQYVWDFGNGERGGGAKIAHLFAAAGNETVTLTVVDGSNRSATSMATITVTAPTVTGTPATTLVVITGVDGAPLAGVGVTPSAAGSALSDAAGNLTVSVSAGATSSLKFSKEGYSDQFLNVGLPTGAGNDGYYRVTMHTRDAAVTLADAAVGGTLSGRDGATIVLPANGFVDASGAAVSGSLQMTITPVDVTQPAAGGFPGDFRGIKPDGTQTLIVSLGVEEFMPTVNGAKVQLAPGKTATITIPIYASMNLDGTIVAVGDSIPLWSLDEATGIWVQEGTGTVVASADSPTGLALSAVVSHLSWWNCDQPAVDYIPFLACEEVDYPEGSETPAFNPTECEVYADFNFNDAAGAKETHSNLKRLTVVPTTRKANAATQPAAIETYYQSYALSAAGLGVYLPANIDIHLIAYAKGGTQVGTTTVHGLAGVTDKVTLLLQPVVPLPPQAITLPFNDASTVTRLGTTQFSFTASAPSVVRVMLSSVDQPFQKGTLQVLQGTTVLATTPIFGNMAFGTLAHLPSAGTYTIAVTVDFPSVCSLQASLEPDDAQVQPITLPFDGTRALLPNPTANFSFTGTQGQYARIVVTGIDASAGNTPTPLTGTLKLLSGATVVGSVSIVSGSAQLLIDLASSGIYTVEVDGTIGASFELTTDLEAVPLNDILTIPTDVTRNIAAASTYNGALKLSATTTVYFDSRHVNGDLTDVRLMAADGTVLFDAPPNAMESETTNSFVATLPAGNYSVQVTAQNGNLATERLFLSTTSWVPVAPTLPATGDFQTIDLVMDRNGKPVVGLVKAGAARTLQLRRWTGTAWETVGTDIAVSGACGQTNLASFAFDSTNNPVVLYASYASDGSSFYTVRRFMSGAWSAVGPNDGKLPLVSTGSASCAVPTTTLVGADDQPVVAYYTNNGAAVQHFDGTHWVGYVTPSGDLFGDAQGTTFFETRFDPSGKLWIVTGSDAVDAVGQARRLNTTTNVWDDVGGPFPQIGTVGLQQPRLRFDSAGSPVVAWLAAVGADGQSGPGMAVYRLISGAWTTTGGYEADDNSFGGDALDPAFVMFNDQAVVAWDNDQRPNLYSSVVAQSNTASGWTPINDSLGSLGTIPQYGHGGLGAAEGHNARLATDGKDVYLTVIAYQLSVGVDQSYLTLLKRASN